MANTYSQIYIQVVIAVRERDALIYQKWEERLYQYITSIVQKNGQKMLVINGMPDHTHFLIGMKPDCCLSNLVREIKKSSNDLINDNKLTTCKFYWQEGFGSFSYSRSQIDHVIKYIVNQKEHHRKKSFREEYIEFLTKFEIEYKDEYIFKSIY